MEWKKAKNIILCVLVFANIFLAVNLATLIEKRWGEEREKVELALANLTQRGHEAAPESVPRFADTLYIYDVYRSTGYEKSVAEGVLGQCSQSSKGGGIEEFSNEQGYFTFRSGGSFVGEIYGTSIEEDFVKIATDIVTSMGVDEYDMSENGTQLFFSVPLEGGFYADDYGVSVEQTTRGVRISGRLLPYELGEKELVKADYSRALLEIASDYEARGERLTIENMSIIYVCDAIKTDESIMHPVFMLTGGGESVRMRLDTLEIIE